MRTVQSIAFDFSVHGVTPRIYGKQGDVNSRFVNISLFDQGAAWLVPDGALLSIRFRTPSGASGLYDTLPDGSSAFEVLENTVLAALAEPIFAESGPVRCELSIAAENAGVTTWCFIVAVEGASVSDQEIPEDYYNGFLSVAAQVAADAKRAEEAANSVDTTLLMNKTMYDPTGNVEAAGGIARYLDSQKGNPNGVASLNDSGVVPMKNGGTGADNSLDASRNITISQDLFSITGRTGTMTSNKAYSFRIGQLVFVQVDLRGCKDGMEFSVNLKPGGNLPDFPYEFADTSVGASLSVNVAGIDIEPIVNIGGGTYTTMRVGIKLGKTISTAVDATLSLWFAIP